MDHGRFRCRHCQRVQRRCTKDQRYCNDKACQRARRNRWRRDKYASDSDYRTNQSASTKAWLDAQGGSAKWYRDYRRRRRREAAGATAPEIPCSEAHGATGELAEAAAVELSGGMSENSDAVCGQNHVLSGTYKLIATDGANSDAILVELLVISDS